MVAFVFWVMLHLYIQLGGPIIFLNEDGECK